MCAALILVSARVYAGGVLSIEKVEEGPSPSSGKGKIYVKEDAVSGGYDSYTKLLLHCDGTNGSTTFTDSAASKGVTAAGNAKVSTAQYKFGGASGLFDGSGDYLTLTDSDDWNFGTGDFTIDFWVRFNTLPDVEKAVALFSQMSDALHRVSFYIYNDAGTYIYRVYNYNGAMIINLTGTSPGFSTGVWYHIALVRSGNNFYIYQNGVQCMSMQDADAWPDYAANFNIGYQPYTGAESYLNGYIDEFRVSKGIARWTSNFTVPATEYSAESSKTLNLYYKDDKGKEYRLN